MLQQIPQHCGAFGALISACNESQAQIVHGGVWADPHTKSQRSCQKPAHTDLTT